MVLTAHTITVQWENLTALSRLHSLGALYVTPARIARETGYLERDVLVSLEDAEGLGLVQTDRQRNGWRLRDRVVTSLIHLQVCDVCKYFDMPESRAIADARLPKGHWGYVCADHFVSEGCRLGPGLGQFLRLEY